MIDTEPICIRACLLLTTNKTPSLFTKVALLVVGVDFVAEVIHILVICSEADLVLVAALAAASPMEVACVRRLWQTDYGKDGIGCMANASLVHRARLCCSKLTGSARTFLRLVGAILLGIGTTA